MIWGLKLEVVHDKADALRDSVDDDRRRGADLPRACPNSKFL